MSNKRLYNDKEISAVLKRAAELQRDQGPDQTSGLSLEELEQIAADVGIDPAFVKTAAREIDQEHTQEAYRALGAPTFVDLERIVDGGMSEERWGEIVAEIRRIYDVVGEVGQVGHTREWIYRDQTGERMHVTATPTGDQTKIRVYTRMTDFAIALFAPILSVALVLTILQFVLLHWGPAIETGLAIAIFTLFHTIARLSYRALARSQERKARDLLNRIDELFATASEAPSPERLEQAASSTSRAGLIDEALRSDEVPPEAASSTRRREREG